ncbi:LRR receptor-like serine/threonine-protein kinase FLS2 [Cornus florida]|uniref:LRR receptor-like serine/threonine-protein kinase FLS2 n=1 Tax=Cornus florida TaxID=4283 RepID=UPI0028A23CE8|nr:LRR receptor-like serine/threonine-protein kinase FLS2 [Cornus florida]
MVAVIFVLMQYRKQMVKLSTNIDSLPLKNADSLPLINEDLSSLIWRIISYQELLLATDAFNEANLIGVGSFGSVYKGTLSDGMIIAAKPENVLLDNDMIVHVADFGIAKLFGERDLLAQTTTLATIGYMAPEYEMEDRVSTRCDVYSYGVLLMEIFTRKRLTDEICRISLGYLHNGHVAPIVHCDLKPENVLLDEDMIAHVTDFGIAKLFGERDLLAQTITLATIGYMAPEYEMEDRVSTRCDVYSYGVLLMEIFTKKRPIDEMFAGEMKVCQRDELEVLGEGNIRGFNN